MATCHERMRNGTKQFLGGAILIAALLGPAGGQPPSAMAQAAKEAVVPKPEGPAPVPKKRARSRRFSWTDMIWPALGVAAIGAGLFIYQRQKKRRPRKTQAAQKPPASKEAHASGATPAAEQAPGDAGEIIGGHRLEKILHAGQFSEVWDAVELPAGRHYALKKMLPEKEGAAELVRLLVHEAEVGLKLNHPNLVKITALDKKRPYYIMDLFPSGNLRMRLLHLDKERAFIRDNAAKILKQWATALAYLHAAGWVHRDVKPDNVLVNRAGELRLIGLALAQRMEKGNFLSRLLKGKPPIQGTRSYMSPEQIRAEALDGRADVYGFGASAFELVTGRPPFRASSSQDLLNKQIAEKAPSPQIYNMDVSDEFSALVLRMLAKKRADRPAGFQEILVKLNTIRIFKTATPQTK